MVILIGGAGCTGKTLMAQRLLEKYKYPYLSLDHLKMGLIRSGADCGFAADSRDWVISARMWPIVRGIIMTAVENNQNLIIEGCYLPPDKLAALDARYLDKIISFYIVFSDKYVNSHYKDILAHRCDIESRMTPEERSADDICGENEHYAIICSQSGARFFTIEKDYDAETSEIYRWINEKLGK